MFGYFPALGEASTIHQLDPSSGKFRKPQWTVPTSGSHADAWAFAFWGGVFYVFATYDDVPRVYAVHRASGKAQRVLDHVPYRITGSGVSTCAPELERAE